MGSSSYGYYWHIHHNILFEKAMEPIENRIDYIKKYKSPSEIPLRLKLLRRAKLSPKIREFIRVWNYFEGHNSGGRDFRAIREKLYFDEIMKLHAEQCVPDCPWNGRTIFTKFEE